MRKILVASSLLLTLGAAAQQADSSRYYRYEMARLRRQHDSAFRATEAWQRAQAAYDRSRYRSRSFGGWVVGAGVM